ncbi:MAG: GTPase HflX [Ruminococcaceae bacterium]|nr:GTPase HflX [Oscillospiraceae bacterium]
MEKILEKAVLIAVQTKDITEEEAELSIAELGRLVETAGAEPCVSVVQKRENYDVASYIGRGKALEIAEICKNNEITLAVIDDEISGSQAKNLEDILDVRVIDRTMLILDIFAARAKTAEGRLQVELAQLKYLLPRLMGLGKSLSRLGGGIGTRGPGETKLETDRRHIRRKINSLEEQLEKVEQRRLQARRRRDKNAVPSVALVGYTNAGKSSLMNVLCCSNEVYVEDKLFATLDSTTRKMVFPDSPKSNILLTDTVGFIRKLPHTLVEAFKSTLEEATSADLLLHVVDSSDSELSSHIETVTNIIRELGIEHKPVWLIMNKNDRLAGDREVNASAVMAACRQNGMKVFSVSAKTGDGINELRQSIKINMEGDSHVFY